MKFTLAVALCCTFLTPMLPPAACAAPVRIKDLVEFDGVRGNDLVGYGLVVGLNGTGDGLRNSPYTQEIMQNLLERLGVNVTGETFQPRNVAAVFVTAALPPFARAGGRIDVAVSAMGDAKSLLGRDADHDAAERRGRQDLCGGSGRGDRGRRVGQRPGGQGGRRGADRRA